MIFLVLNGKHITTQQCIDLKKKLDDELRRRDGYGAVNNLPVNFQNTPTPGKKTYTQQGQAIINNFLHVKDYGDLKNAQENDPIPSSFSMDKLGTEIDKLTQEPRTGETSDTKTLLGKTGVIDQSSCRGACTGLCVGSCFGNCNGCSGCSTGCSSCTGCSNTCNDTCYSQCDSTCSHSCTTGCTSCAGCSNGCSTGCYSACTGTCGLSCNTGCQGCTATCGSNCAGGCSGCSSCSGVRS